MKKVQDISIGNLESNLEVFQDKIIEILPDKLEESHINDLSPETTQDIDMYYKTLLRVDKKYTRNFDALEMNSRKLWQKVKNISLKKKENTISQKTEVYVSKKLQKIQKVGYVLLGIGILIFSIVYAFFAKIIIENRVNSGYEKLILVKHGNLDFQEIHKNINNARFDFILSDILFTPFSFIPSVKISSVNHVISGGKHISTSLDQILGLYEKIHAYTNKKEIGQIYFTQLLLNIYNDVYDTRKTLEKATAEYEKISWLPTDSLKQQRDSALRVLELGTQYVDVFLEDFQNFVNILGHEQRRRYLIVFQNSDEIRPTGGFMGSMALVEMFKGQIKLFQKKDVYAIEWDLKSAEYDRLPAPKGLSELTDTFGLRDANYFINLEDSSRAIKFFTDNANIQIDGIIYINQNILIKLLELTGPVYFKDIDQEVNSENFSYVMSLLVESKISKQGTLGTPKQVLFDFIEIFTQKLIQDGKYFEYLQILTHEAKSRDIMMWSFNPEENNFLGDLGINGNINYESSLDFMYPVYTSLSGNKSDRYIQRDYKTQVTRIINSCDLMIRQEITSSHNMGKLERESITAFIKKYNLQGDNLLEIQGNARNRQYVRVLLPEAADIEPQENMDIIDYGKRKGIEFFLTTPVQQAEYFTFSYKLKNPKCRKYDISYYKQPGVDSYNVELELDTQKFEFKNRQEDFYFEKG